jgi:ferredoxin
MAWALELPLLNDSRCTGCGACVAICPTACLEQWGFHPWLPRPLACVRCGLCVAICPVDALTLVVNNDE